jgi:triosephosphate isomerase
MRQKLVIANWKMNGDADLVVAHREKLAETDFTADVAICPPFVYLHTAGHHLADTNIALGAQDVSDHAEGAYTGQISAQMLREQGCKYVIIGHSERRALCAETNEIVAEKFVQAQTRDLIPVLCVGETLFQREQGQTEEIVITQLKTVVQRSGIAALSKAVLAYEPVWAIGTGEAATPAQAQEVHATLRAWLQMQDANAAENLQMLYGGSVKPDNAQELFSQPDIDGGLIGGAALQPEAFAAIVKAAS